MDQRCWLPNNSKVPRICRTCYPPVNATAATLLRIPNCFSFIIDQNGPRGQAIQTYFPIPGATLERLQEPKRNGHRHLESRSQRSNLQPCWKLQKGNVIHTKILSVYSRYKSNMCVYIDIYIYICICVSYYVYISTVKIFHMLRIANLLHCSVLAKPSSAQRLPYSDGSLGIEDQLVEKKNIS